MYGCTQGACRLQNGIPNIDYIAILGGAFVLILHKRSYDTKIRRIHGPLATAPRYDVNLNCMTLEIHVIILKKKKNSKYSSGESLYNTFYKKTAEFRYGRNATVIYLYIGSNDDE